jgi:hypothetical protein
MPYLSREHVCESPLSNQLTTCCQGLRAALLGVAFLASAPGCYRTSFSTTAMRDFGYEHRTPTDAEGEGITSEWQVESGRITGKVDWGSCQIERMSYRTDEVTRRREPDKLLGYVLLGGGVLSTLVGFSLWSASASCPNGGCSGERNVTFLVLGLGAGLPAMGVGGMTLLGKPSLSVEKTERHEDVKKEVSGCIQQQDLAELALVLEVEAGKKLPVQLSADGSAVIELPAGFQMPRGVELPILVERAPPRSGDVLERAQVIGTVSLDADSAQTP